MIVFCTTCKGRTQHLERTLPKNLDDNKDYKDAKFVILDYNSSDNLVNYLKENHQKDIDSGRVVVYQYKEPVPFRMAHAKNMAHRCGILEGADILVNLDADNFTEPGFASYIAEQFNNEKDIFLWALMIKEEGNFRLSRGISGRIAVSRDAFINSGGYDEKYETYSPDDKDFNARLRRMGYTAKEIDRRFLKAVLHNDKMRFKEYKHVANVNIEEEFEINQVNRVVNHGQIGLGKVWRNFSAEPIELKTLPTRIFGIGMHKTATTSLNAAFNILGFKSGHWKTAHWAKAIWNEMNMLGSSSTLEKYYVLSDLPIPLLYEELDIAYPNSKFILTIRDEVDWLQSVKKHWSSSYNKFRHVWDTDPFTHKVHKLLYGQKGFDAEIFLKRYKKHNADVKEYFKNRPHDLLVMDMDKGHGWPELCEFLDVPIPSVEYPNELVTPP